MKAITKIIAAALAASLVFAVGCATRKTAVADEWENAETWTQKTPEAERPGEGVGRVMPTPALKPEPPGEGVGRIMPAPETRSSAEQEDGADGEADLPAPDADTEASAQNGGTDSPLQVGGDAFSVQPGWDESPEQYGEAAWEEPYPGSETPGSYGSAEVPAAEPAEEIPAFTAWRAQTICIDPGHGFIDGGAGPGLFSLGTVEKDITIVVARMLRDELQERGFDAVLTHNGLSIPEGADKNGDNIFSAPYERPGYINDVIDPDYLVSLHVNAVENYSPACGVIVYYSQSAAKVNDWSQSAGQSIADAIEASALEKSAPTRLTNDQETADASFAINRETRAASCLIEMGFCTNPTDANLLQDPAWQAQLAEAIAVGIEAFFDRVDAGA